MKKKMSAKQIFAILAIFLLLAMYIVTLIFAIISNGYATIMLKASLACTFLVPVLAYLVIMFFKLSHRNSINGEDTK